MKFPWHQEQLDRLVRQLANGYFAHAYLVIGSAGIGKQQFIDTLTKHILCDKHAACGHCQNCTLLSAGNHPDRHLCQEVSGHAIKIDQVRQLVSYEIETPQIANKKVIIIHDAHKMTRASSNALLKTLEEPTPSTCLLISTDKPHLLLPTIRSRCQSVSLNINRLALHDWLIQQGHSEYEINHLPLSYAHAPLKAHEFLSDDIKAKYHMFLEHIRYSQSEALLKFLVDQESPALLLSWWQEFVAKLYIYSPLTLNPHLWKFYDTLTKMVALIDRQVAYNQALMWRKLSLIWIQNFQRNVQHCFE